MPKSEGNQRPQVIGTPVKDPNLGKIDKTVSSLDQSLAYVDIFPESAPTTDENYFLIYDHPYSFEAASFMKESLEVDRPVCHMNAGYSSGWCQVAFGVDLVAKEISCRAKGDDKCIFVMAHPSKINERVVEMREKYGV